MHSIELVQLAYAPLLELADEIDDGRGWLATPLPGWTVRDLLFHLAADCQRALVAFGTPAERPADTDAVSYWTAWRPNTAEVAAGLRGTRIIASAWSSVRGPAELFAETAGAMLHVYRDADPERVVRTQGHRLRVDSLLRTLAVEAAIHHLDLQDVLGGPPAGEALAEVRATLDGLLGVPAPRSWDEVRYALVGTGRAVPSELERAELGELAAKLPLLG